jgi:hypothetical protein
VTPAASGGQDRAARPRPRRFCRNHGECCLTGRRDQVTGHIYGKLATSTGENSDQTTLNARGRRLHALISVAI